MSTETADYWSGHYADALRDIQREAVAARHRYPPFNSAHEGWAVLYEEVDEIWDEVRANNVDAAIAEAIQAGAMCVRFVADMRAKAAGAGRGGGNDQQEGARPSAGAAIANPAGDQPRPRPQEAAKRTCEICGRVGTRRYVFIGDISENRWKCSPTATGCAPQFGRRTKPKPAAPPKGEPPQVDASESCAKPEPEPVSRPPSFVEGMSQLADAARRRPAVTARCQDCSHTWTLTGRVLDIAIEQHELKHSHIVTAVANA